MRILTGNMALLGSRQEQDLFHFLAAVTHIRFRQLSTTVNVVALSGFEPDSSTPVWRDFSHA